MGSTVPYSLYIFIRNSRRQAISVQGGGLLSFSKIYEMLLPKKTDRRSHLIRCKDSYTYSKEERHKQKNLLPKEVSKQLRFLPPVVHWGTASMELIAAEAKEVEEIQALRHKECLRKWIEISDGEAEESQRARGLLVKVARDTESCLADRTGEES
jgi:hypothetical protein